MIIKGNSVGYPLPDPRKGMDMSGNAINNLANPLNSGDAANKGYVDGGIADAKKYADDKHFELTATIPVSGWFAIANSAYENNLDVAGVLGSDKVEVDVRMDDTSWEGIANNILLEEEFAKIYHIPVGDGRLYIRARELPTIDIPIKIKVVR